MKGYSYNPSRKRNPYQARMQIAGKYISLGSHPTAEAAHAAYCAALAANPRKAASPRNRAVCSYEEATAALRYSPESGLFHWRVNRRPAIKPGDRAGTINSHGYVQICINGRALLAHRLAWLMTHGVWPSKMIDHINGDPSDNRMANLREATGSQNQANRGARKDSTTGVRGVRLLRSGKWAAQIQIGSFQTKEAASAAYLRLAEICYGEFAPTDRHPQSYASRLLGEQART